MKIALAGSIDFTEEIRIIAEKLRALGHEVTLPRTSEKIIKGNLRMKDILEEKRNGKIVDRGIEIDALRKYFRIIDESDVLLVVNLDKKGIENYIGGATLMEMGFAQVLDKKVFLLNGIPEMGYTDEIKIMQPVILGGTLEKLASYI